jgi:hypothetical protein
MMGLRLTRSFKERQSREQTTSEKGSIMKNKNPIYSILGLGSALMLVLAVVGCASSGTQVTHFAIPGR